jgi:hypothetical protein
MDSLNHVIIEIFYDLKFFKLSQLILNKIALKEAAMRVLFVTASCLSLLFYAGKTFAETDEICCNWVNTKYVSGRTIITHLFAVLLISTGTLTLAFTVLAENSPTAGDDIYRAEVGTTLHKTAVDGVLTNDTDADNDMIKAVLATDVSNGTLILNSDGSFTYAHDGSQTTSV